MRVDSWVREYIDQNNKQMIKECSWTEGRKSQVYERFNN